MTNSRGQVKSRAYTLKEDYKAMALKESQKCEKLKISLAIEKQKTFNLENDIRQSNELINFYQQKVIDNVEKGRSLRKSWISVIFTTGVIAGAIAWELLR